MVTGLVKISINCSPLPFLFSASLVAPRFSLLFTDTKRHGLCLLVHRLQEKPCRLTKRLCDCGAYWHYHTIRFVLYQQKFFLLLAIICALLQLFIVVLVHYIKKVSIFSFIFYSFFHFVQSSFILGGSLSPSLLSPLPQHRFPKENARTPPSGIPAFILPVFLHYFLHYSVYFFAVLFFYSHDTLLH